MTAYGDMCTSPHCGDIASPGHLLCTGCIADRQAERAAVSAAAVVRTAEHEASVEAQETT